MTRMLARKYNNCPDIEKEISISVDNLRLQYEKKMYYEYKYLLETKEFSNKEKRKRLKELEECAKQMKISLLK